MNAIASIYSTVKPYVSGPLAAILVNGAKLSIPLVSGELTQTAPAAVEATGGVETALSGTAAAEDGMLASQAGNAAVEGTDAAKAGSSALGGLGEIGLGTIVSVGSFGASVYGAAQTCANYGAVSLQCAGAALGTALSYGAQAICTAATAGAGSAVCGILQSVIAAVVPLIVTGNGQAFLDSVTFSSGFNIGNAQVLAAQVAIAYVLGPIGAAALLGETIYANWSAIQSAFVYVGNAIASALETAGNAVLSGIEAAGGTVVSGISTAGEAVASGLSSFVSYLSSLGDTVRRSAFSNLGSNIAYVVDSVGSALCDYVNQIECFFSGGSRVHGSRAAGGGGARRGSGAGRGRERFVRRRAVGRRVPERGGSARADERRGGGHGVRGRRPRGWWPRGDAAAGDGPALAGVGARPGRLRHPPAGVSTGRLRRASAGDSHWPAEARADCARPATAGRARAPSARMHRRPHQARNQAARRMRPGQAQRLHRSPTTSRPGRGL